MVNGNLGKDQLIGAGILVVCVVVAAAFVVLQLFPVPVANLLGMTVDSNTGITFRLNSVLILVSVAFIAILGDRCMDRLYNGNYSTAKTNRRNNNRDERAKESRRR